MPAVLTVFECIELMIYRSGGEERFIEHCSSSMGGKEGITEVTATK
jgi:hypothetical protein